MSPQPPEAVDVTHIVSLKPCPFCRSKKIKMFYHERIRLSVINCMNKTCAAVVSFRSNTSPTLAQQQWNDRRKKERR